MAKTKIEWTANINPDGTVSQGFTFNPWRGCSKVSPACKNCYAMELVNRFGGDFLGKRVVASESMWKQPLKWNREAAEKGVRYRVFCASLSDVFEDYKGWMLNAKGDSLWIVKDCGTWLWANATEHEALSQQKGVRLASVDDVRARVFRLIDATPNLDWLLLTKRPENILKMWPKVGFPDAGVLGTLGRRLRLENVWLGTTVENQEQADKRIPELLKCRDLSPVLFLSCEPLLGRVDLRPALWLEDQYFKFREQMQRGIGWVISGGESGKDFRPMQTNWVQSMHEHCKSASVPFFCKQGSGPKSGQQYDLPDYLFGVKEFPS